MKAQYKEIEEKMNKTLDSLYREFGTIRAGKASPSVLDRVTVDYYGAATPIQQLFPPLMQELWLFSHGINPH